MGFCVGRQVEVGLGASTGWFRGLGLLCSLSEPSPDSTLLRYAELQPPPRQLLQLSRKVLKPACFLLLDASPPLPTNKSATIRPAAAEKQHTYHLCQRTVAAAAHTLAPLFDEVESLPFADVESRGTAEEGAVRVAAAADEVKSRVFHYREQTIRALQGLLAENTVK